jgi:hypothetical protein
MKKKLMVQILVSICFFALFSCKQDISYKQMEEQVGKITSLTELGTVEYVVTKIVKANDNATWYKFGDRKILFSCKAILKAGIDLSKLEDSDIKANIEKKSISITLPEAELLSVNLKPENIKLIYEKTSITRSSFSNKERDAVLAQGEADILKSVPDMGIFDDAESNAKLFLEAFFKQAGFTDVNIEFKKHS